jgi:hypothetical protein
MMRAKAGWENVPVVMLTARSQQKDKSRATEFGATAYLVKPFRPEELRARVRELTRGGSSDIARAVRNALREAKQESGAAAVTLVSDGAQASDQLMLKRRLEAGDSSRRLGAKLGELLGDADGVDVLQAVGLGRLPGRVNQSAARTDKLVEIWMTACEKTGAANCETTTEL